MSTFLKIPDYVLSDKKLDGDNKILLSKIIDLHNIQGQCYASNNMLGDYLGMSRTSVSKRITKLKSLGYIITKEVWNGKIQVGRIIVPIKKGSSQSSKGIVPEVQGGSSQSSKGVVPEVGTNISLLKEQLKDEYTGSGVTLAQYYRNKNNTK